jgi:hypothetical protein
MRAVLYTYKHTVPDPIRGVFYLLWFDPCTEEAQIAEPSHLDAVTASLLRAACRCAQPLIAKVSSYRRADNALLAMNRQPRLSHTIAMAFGMSLA